MKKRKLTRKQLLFCKLYATKGKYFGNGTQSYAEAYDTDLTTVSGNRAARVGAHDNLTKPSILKEINRLLELEGFNDTTADRELLFLIEQKAEFGPKLGAIKEYNALKSRITKKLELFGGIVVDNLSPEEREKNLRAEISEVLEDERKKDEVSA